MSQVIETVIVCQMVIDLAKLVANAVADGDKAISQEKLDAIMVKGRAAHDRIQNVAADNDDVPDSLPPL